MTEQVADDESPLTFDLNFYLEHFRAGRGTAEFINMTAVQKLTGPLDVDAFVAACRAVIERQDTIRSVAVPAKNGRAAHLSILPADAVTVEVIDLSDAGDAAEAEAKRLASERAWATIPFDESILYRFFLIKLPRDAYVGGVVCHHFLSDAISLAIIWRDIAEAYRRIRTGEALVPPLKLSFRDFLVERIAWDQNWRSSKNAAHWNRVLEKLGPESGHRTTPVPNGPRVRPSLDFGAEKATLAQIARRERVTPFTVMLALFAGVLLKHTPGDTMTVGIASDQRYREEYLDLCGFFVGVVPVFLDASGDPSFRTMVQRARRAAFDLLENPWAPADVAAHSYRNRISLHILDYVDLQKFAIRFADDIKVAPFALEPPPTQGMTANAFVFAQGPDFFTGSAVGQFTEHWAHYANVLQDMKTLMGAALAEPDASIAALLR